MSRVSNLRYGSGNGGRGYSPCDHHPVTTSQVARHGNILGFPGDQRRERWRMSGDA
jgi:hypothetical protein